MLRDEVNQSLTMSEHTHGNTQAFIVRIWFEETDGEESAQVQRGSIEHVSSKRQIYFQDMTEMLKFIEDRVGT